jgi:outer membrane protein assembly factor BamB
MTISMQLKRIGSGLALGLCLLAAPPALQAATPSSEDVAAAGGDAGLVLHLGTSDGRFEAQLAASGRTLIHGIALDAAAVDAARKHLLAEGAYGVATVDAVASLNPLPHAENLINVLVADLDALGAKAPPEKELLRVLVPDGVALLRKGGTWTRTVKPRAKEMDVWTHPHGSAANNPVSADSLVGPVTTVRWIDGYAGASYHMSQAGLPVANETALLHDDKWMENDENNKRQRQYSLVCRDPYNGLPRWQQPLSGYIAGMYLAGDTALSAHPVQDDKGDFLRGYDVRTGKLAQVYNQGGTLKEVKDAKSPAMDVVAGGGTIYQAAGKTLYALDLKTGKRRWAYTRDDLDAMFSPTVTPDGTKVCVVENKGRSSGWRWPSVYIGAITCLDPKTGKVLWRNTDLANLCTAYTPITDQRLMFYTIWGIGSMTEGVPKGPERAKLPRDFGVIDLATGKILWKKGPLDDDGASGFAVNTGMIWGRELMLMNSVEQVAYDIDTGKLLRKMNPSIVNQRCTRVKAAGEYLLGGFGTFLTKDGRYVDQNISRSACAVGMTPANGTVFQTRNGCGCFSMIRAYAGFAAETPLPLLPAAKRLEKTGGTLLPGGPVRPQPEVRNFPVKNKEGQEVGSIRPPVSTGKPVRDAWINNENLPFPETKPTAASDRELVSVVCEHRLESRLGGKVVWAFVADGRISHRPLVHQGRVYVGARDGYVYCLDQKTGALQWRFLAAANHRRILAYGGLESAWPIFDLALHDGSICASAGRHPELDGGILLWGLDPVSGKPEWSGTIRNDTASTWMKLGDKRAGDRHVNYLTNGRLVSDGGKLRLVAGDWAHGGGNKKPARNEPLEIDPAKPPK